CPAPHGAGGLGPRRMGRHGEESRSAFLLPHSSGAQTTGARRRELGAPHRRRLPGTAFRIGKPMAWLDRIRNVFHPSRLQSDLDRELRFHMQERADDLAASGMNPADAARAARLQFGNYTSQIERTRDMDISQALEAAGRHLRLAFRSLRKTPAFSATVILTLALGIGANSAVFSAIDAILLKPLPFPRAGELMLVKQVDSRNSNALVAAQRLEDWNRLATAFQGITGSYSQDESETSGELPERLTRALVAPRFLRVLGVAPEVGRDFT